MCRFSTNSKSFPGALPDFGGLPSFFDIALLGGSVHYHLSVQVAAEVTQFFEVTLSFLVDGGIRVVDVQALRLYQQPMKTDNLNAGFFSRDLSGQSRLKTASTIKK
jgi:hypothetical protein